MRQKNMLRNALFYMVFLIVIVGSIKQLVQKQVLYIPTADLIALQTLDNTKYDSITLGLEPYRGIMLAVNFLGNVKLSSIEDSYFQKLEFRPDKITTNNPLLTTENSCFRSMAIDFTKLSSELVLISSIRQLDKNYYYFNRGPDCNGMKLHSVDGFSGIEEWGAWSDGDRTEFAIETGEDYPRGGKLIISVRPVINPKLSNDKRIILINIDGKHEKYFEFSSPNEASIEIDFDKKELGSKISVVINHTNTMKFSDIDGTDHRNVSLGFITAKLISNGNNGYIQIVSMTGANDRETDGKNWWHWVGRQVNFKLQSLHVPKDVTQAKLHFEYGTRTSQTLTVRILARDGSSRQFLLHSQENASGTFEKIIDLPPSELTEVSISTDGKASRLGDQDARIAAWMIRNVLVSPVSP